MTEELEPTEWRPHSAHWGTFAARWTDGRLAVRPHSGDPDPNAIAGEFQHRACATRRGSRSRWCGAAGWSMVREPDDRRGRDEFVAVSWDRALGPARRRTARGCAMPMVPGAIYGGSYGWASAGRFHHAQGQMHRFLNIVLGGYVRSVNSYSAGASNVILPHIMGSLDAVGRHGVTWDQIAAHSEVVVAFGGMALKNSAIAAGGVSRHVDRGAMQAAQERGARFVLISPLRDDLPAEAEAEWLPVVPNTDTALMLGLAHTLVDGGAARSQLFSIVSASAIPMFEDLSARPHRRAAKGCRMGRARSAACCGRRYRRPGACNGGAAHTDRRRARAATRGTWRAAGVDGGGARGDAGPDRVAGRRLRLCARHHGPLRTARGRRAVAHRAAGPQRRARVHPGGAHRGHAAAARCAVRV